MQAAPGEIPNVSSVPSRMLYLFAWPNFRKSKTRKKNRDTLTAQAENHILPAYDPHWKKSFFLSFQLEGCAPFLEKEPSFAD